MRTIAVALVAALLGMTSARADFGPYGLKGNDTGGIIPWTPAIDLIYQQLASDFCARFFKGSQITSVHRRIGDYVAFACRFDRGYDPVKARYYTLSPPLPPVTIQKSAPIPGRPILTTPPVEK